MEPMAGMMPLFRPELIVAAASAVMEAIQTWLALRDRRATAEAAATEYSSALSDPAVHEEAREVENLVPASILGAMIGRVDTCFKRYQEVLITEGGFLPGEVDEANDAVIACVCRELRRMYRLNRTIPAGRLKRFWDVHCQGT